MKDAQVPSENDCCGNKEVQEKLGAVRLRIDELDSQLAALLAERLALADEVANVKANLHIGIKDPAREQEILTRVAAVAPDRRIADAIKEIYRSIFACSRRLQQRKVAPKDEPLVFPLPSLVELERRKG